MEVGEKGVSTESVCVYELNADDCVCVVMMASPVCPAQLHPQFSALRPLLSSLLASYPGEIGRASFARGKGRDPCVPSAPWRPLRH